jgi:hypothetical protein
MTRERIRLWMRYNADRFIDPKTLELDATSLVEAWDNECADGKTTLDSNHDAWTIGAEILSDVIRAGVGR